MRWLALSSVVVVFWLHASAQAQADEQERQVALEAEGGDDSSAQEVFELGRRATVDGRYTEAARYFERAYELSPRSVLLYNIGISHERAGQAERAVTFLERYLASGDEVPRRVEVEERLRVLRESMDAESEQVDVEIGAPAEPEPSGRSVVGPVLLMGGGAALGIVGAIFLGLASGAANDVTDASRTTSEYWIDWEDEASQASTFSVLGGVFIGIGAAVLVGGLVWLVTGGDDEEAVAVSVAPNGVLVRGRF